MKLFESVRNVFTRKPSRFASGRRSIAAVLPGVATQGILKMETSCDEVLRGSLTKLRASSRGMAQNNGYVRQFLRMVEHHVVGPKGVKFQNKARRANWSLNNPANDVIEAAYAVWCKPENCDVRKKASFRGLQKLVIRTVARDGECFVRKVSNHANSAHRFALQVIPAELIDETYWDERKNIRLGIEFDEWGAPVAYYLRQSKASHFTVPGLGAGRNYIRIPADEMIHVFFEEFPDQSRGIPWICSAVIRLEQLNGYEEAEAMAARVGALKGGFIKTPDGNGSALADGQDEAGNFVSELSPGAVELLPPGYEFQGFDPTHPSGNFGPFVKESKRGISSAVGVSYNLLANDLEGVNYSSIRAGVQEERENWKSLQIGFAEMFLDKVPADWAKYASLVGALDPIPASNVERLITPLWRFRGWAWIDPLKDVDAAVTAVNEGLRCREDILAEQGVDFEELLQRLAEEQRLIKKYGVVVGEHNMLKPVPALAPPAREDGTADPDNEDETTDVKDEA